MSPEPEAAAGAGERWLARSGGHWLLSLRVQPGARRTEPAGIVEGRLKLRLAAPPVEGKANEALLRWIADALDLRQRDVELASGQTSRQKRVRFACALPGQEIERRLLRGSCPKMQADSHR